MTPVEYFESFVEGNALDSHEYPNCVRRAFNAAVSASHLADHVFAYDSRADNGVSSQFESIGKYVEHLSEQTAGAFKDVRSIANAYKHLYTSTDSRKAAHASVSSAGAIVSVELMDSDSEIASLFEDYDGARAAVVFVRKDGSKAEFLPVLDKVLDYWRGALCEGA